MKNKDKIWLIAYIATIILPFGLIFNRGIAEGCVAIIGVSFLVDSFLRKNFQWLHDPVIKIGLIAWVWLLFVSFFAQNVHESYGVAIPWIRYLLLYASLKNFVLVKADDIKSLGKILAVMMFLVIIDTLWQYVFGVSLTGHLRDKSGRLTGPMSNVKAGIFMAKIFGPSIGILLFFAVVSKNYKAVIASVFLLFLTIATILITGERTAFASTMISVLTASFFLAICEPKLRKFVIAAVATLILLAGILFVSQDWVQDRAIQFYDTISNYPTTEYGQLAKGGILIGENNLLTGAGLKGFRALCPDLFASGAVTTCNLHPHNLYIEWFAETGVIGLLLFASMVFCLFFAVAKIFIKHRGIERLLPAFALAGLVTNFFPFMPTQSIFSNWPAILLWYSIAVAISAMSVLNSKTSAF